MAGGKKLTQEEEILLQDFSRTVTKKSQALFYLNALMITILPLCKYPGSLKTFFELEIVKFLGLVYQRCIISQKICLFLCRYTVNLICYQDLMF